jgi:glycosyltransferase involved in cell wall biosynthesis
MRIGYLTSGAGGMFCGSCLRDNTLATTLQELGHDAVLIPTFTPIRTDEADVSLDRVFYGGINVYLQQSPWTSWLFRHTPRFVDQLLNRRGLLAWAGRRTVNADYAKLGAMTLSMLRGEDGRQRKEVGNLVDWLRDDLRPDVLILTNALLSGAVPAIRRELAIPVVVTLQGDDLVLGSLPAGVRADCLEEIRNNDRSVAGYLSTSHTYADAMAHYLGIPRDKIEVVYPGLNLAGHGGPRVRQDFGTPVIGYFARISPEKGLHHRVDAFIRLRQNRLAPPARLRVAGWLGDQHRPYLAAQEARLAAAGLAGDYEHVDCPDLASKVRFLQSLDVFSVPADYHEPKGLYVLEAWANEVPVVQPHHGIFPELIGATGGGLLVEPGNPAALADGLFRLLADPDLRRDLGRRGLAGVRERFTARHMAEATAAVLHSHVNPGTPLLPPAPASVS